MPTKVATQIADTEPANPSGRELPLVRPECVQRNRPGSVFCEWHCRFPEGGIADDLKEPGIWRRVQDNAATAFKRFDEVRIIAFDASWVAHCVVAHATGNAVILAVRGITKLPEQQENLFQDDIYAVVFVGNGYAVVRKRDGQQVVEPVHSADAARGRLLNLYPQQVT